ncbi:MAG: hypothetical protein AB7G47_08295 [Mycolicibacterium sp.]|uniref:hypothetical protein n=1 Tax=Mycolicibacterium sp. TaxID=2320850 RepID=UPI003D115379
MTRLNNLDEALTPKPEPDEWDEPDEPSESRPAMLALLGHRPDKLFTPAHEIGAALREQRRRNRGTGTSHATGQ